MGCDCITFCMYVCIYRFQNDFLRCPISRLHCFLSSHWLSFSFLEFMAFFIPSLQFSFSLPRALFCFGIQFNAILCSHLSAIRWTWPYHVSWFCSISFLVDSSNHLLSHIYISNSDFCWYSRGSFQCIHLSSFKPSFFYFLWVSIFQNHIINCF